MTEMKNSLERLNNKFELLGERINKLENRIIQMYSLRNRKKRMKERKKPNSLRDLCDSISHNTICFIKFQKEKKGRKGLKAYLKETLPKFNRKILIHTSKKLNKLQVGYTHRDLHLDPL